MVLVRRATQDDLKDLWKLHKKRYSEIYKKSIPNFAKADIRKHLPEYYLAIHKGKTISHWTLDQNFTIKFTSLEGEPTEIEHIAFLEDEYTLKNHRGKGVSSAIVEQIEADLKTSGVQYIYAAAETEEMPAWFEERGYTKLGNDCTSCVLAGNQCNGCPIYRKELR